MLRELQLDGTIYNKIDIAIERMKTMEPIAINIYGGFSVMVSGGKDSTVITDLAIRSGIKCKFEVSWTGIEYPETVYFLRKEKERVEALGYEFNFILPRNKDGKQITMWKLIEKKGFPTRKMRFCCEELKEVAGKNSFCILGVRWAESIHRRNNRFIYEKAGKQIMTNNDNEAKRRIVENCMKKSKYMLNPIIEWKDDEVWEYIKERNLPYNQLYDIGYKRVGCIGCPMKNRRERIIDFEKYPKWAMLYKCAGEKYLMEKREKGKIDIETYFNWYVNL